MRKIRIKTNFDTKGEGRKRIIKNYFLVLKTKN